MLEALLGAWSRLSLGRVGLLDLLSSSRVPALVLGLLGPGAVYLLARPSLGRRAAGASAVLLAAHPAWLHACAVTAEGSRVGSISVLVLAVHQASLGGRAPRARRAPLVWPVVCGLVLGFGVALSEATLWVLPLLLAHYWVSQHRSFRRLVGRARLPLPPSLVACALFAPVASVALNPTLWKKVGVGVVRWWLDPLSSAGLAAGFTGPRGVARAVGWVWDTSPLVTLLCAIAGIRGHRASRARSAIRLGQPAAEGRSTRPGGARRARAGIHADPARVAAAGAVAVCPAARSEPAVPGARCRLGSRRDRDGSGSENAARCGWSPAVSSWAESAARRADCRPSDVTVASSALVAAAVDRLGAPEVALDAPDVPAEYWRVLATAGRIAPCGAGRPGRARRPNRRFAAAAKRPGSVLATVTHRGTVLWTLRAEVGRSQESVSEIGLGGLSPESSSRKRAVSPDDYRPNQGPSAFARVGAPGRNRGWRAACDMSSRASPHAARSCHAVVRYRVVVAVGGHGCQRLTTRAWMDRGRTPEHGGTRGQDIPTVGAEKALRVAAVPHGLAARRPPRVLHAGVGRRARTCPALPSHQVPTTTEGAQHPEDSRGMVAGVHRAQSAKASRRHSPHRIPLLSATSAGRDLEGAASRRAPEPEEGRGGGNYRFNRR